MKIFVFRDFIEDRRVSMNLYADQLVDLLQKQADNFSLEEFQPTMPEWLDNTWGMRWARYGLYPWQALRVPAGQIGRAHV